MMFYDQFRAMNTDILLVGEGDHAKVRAGFQEARHFIQESEFRFTRFSVTSELSQLNQAAGRWFETSTAMFELVQEALRCVDLTDGLFDPSILEALRRSGYDRSMDEIRETGSVHLPEDDVIAIAEIKLVQLDSEGSRIWLPPGMSLDLGGIAKGWICEKAAFILANHMHACAVNAGGDMFLFGLPQNKTAWEIDLEDPLNPIQSLGSLQVSQGAVATSTTTKRRWRQGEQERHHLIDPRTGEPALSPWISVTVYAPHATTAEAFAKALLIAGPTEAIRLSEREPQLAFMAVDDQDRLWGSENFQEYFYVQSIPLAKPA